MRARYRNTLLGDVVVALAIAAVFAIAAIVSSQLLPPMVFLIVMEAALIALVSWLGYQLWKTF